MKKNPLELDDSRLIDAILLRFPDRVIDRGLITFLGPFSEREVNEARALVGLQPDKPYQGPRYRDGEYFGMVKIGYDPGEVAKVFADFFREREIKS